MTIVAPILKLQPSNATIEDSDEKKFYWNVVLNYWKLPASFRHFPGPNPISLERMNFANIQNDDFLTALKTDGVRYLLLMTTKPNSTEPISLMIDRALNMYEIEVWANEEFFYNGSLLDGELVWNHNETLQFVIFDVVKLKGINCIERTYRDRLQIIHSHILCTDQTMNDDMVEQMVSEEDKFCARNNLYSMQIFPKMCVTKQRLQDLWNGRKNCSHRNDGIIFTLNNADIHTGTSKYIYKWKPSHSIDIKCHFQDGEWSFFGNDNASDDEVELKFAIPNINMDPNSKLMQMLEQKGQCVVECLLTVKNDEISLLPERERTDKTSANTMKTIEATIRNAVENISIDELLKVTTSTV